MNGACLESIKGYEGFLFQGTTAPTSVNQRASFLQLSIGVFTPEAAALQRHILAVDVIAKTPAAKSQAILSVIWPYPFEFDDRVPPAAVIGIAAEDCKRFGEAPGKIGVPAVEPAHEAVEVRSGTNRKRRRHGC